MALAEVKETEMDHCTPRNETRHGARTTSPLATGLFNFSAFMDLFVNAYTAVSVIHLKVKCVFACILMAGLNLMSFFVILGL